jgi:hypothetical protein
MTTGLPLTDQSDPLRGESKIPPRTAEGSAAKGSESDSPRPGAEQSEKQSEWERVIPWFLTAACTLSLVSIALFLILNVEWFKASVFNQVNITNSYKIYVYHMHLSMIKRSVGLFSGFAMMFVGASVCFYIVKARTDVGFKAQTISLNLVTTSPGIIAMILGASLIMFTIWSKDDFPGAETDSGPPVIQPTPDPTATPEPVKEGAVMPRSSKKKERPK